MTIPKGILWYVSSAGFCFDWNLFFKRKKQQLLSLLDFQDTVTLVNDLIPSQTNCIFTTLYIYKREVLLIYFDSILIYITKVTRQVTQNETRVIISAGNYWLWLNPIPSSFLKSHNLYQNKKSKLQNFFILSEHSLFLEIHNCCIKNFV